MDKINTNETQEFKDFTRSVLRTSESLTVTFTKADGSERVMKCTLNPLYTPPIEVTDPPVPPKEPTEVKEDTVCKVFDIEAQAWRSFKWNSVKRIAFNL